MRVTDKIWLSDKRFDENDIMAAQIRDVFCVAEELDDADVFSMPKRSVALHKFDLFDCTEVPPEAIERFVNEMEAAIEQGHRVLVHCSGGMSRSPSMIAAFLMSFGFSWDEAIAYIAGRVGPHIVSPAREVAISIRRYYYEVL